MSLIQAILVTESNYVTFTKLYQLYLPLMSFSKWDCQFIQPIISHKRHGG